jgi:hypothetical protein
MGMWPFNRIKFDKCNDKWYFFSVNQQFSAIIIRQFMRAFSSEKNIDFEGYNSDLYPGGL